MTPARIEPATFGFVAQATFRLVAQHLNHCAIPVCIVRTYLAVCLITETDVTFGLEITATVPGMWHTSVMCDTVTCSSTVMIEIKLSVI